LLALAFIAIILMTGYSQDAWADTRPGLVAIIPLPSNVTPTGARVNPVTNRIYVPSLDDQLFVIDGDSDTVIATVPLSSGGVGIAVNPSTGLVYVAISTSVVVVDENHVVIATIPVNDALAVDVDPTTNRIYVISNNILSVIDGATHTVIATVPVGQGSQDVAVNPTTGRIYVSNFDSNSISVIEALSNMVVTSIPVAAAPRGLGVNPVTNRIYVTHAQSNIVSVIDGASEMVIATITVGQGPIAIGVNPVTNRVYVANNAALNSADLSIIDGASNVVLTKLPIRGPMTSAAVGVDPNTDRIYVPGADDTFDIDDVFVFGPLSLFHLRATGANANPTNLLLETDPPISTTPKFRDSAGLNFAAGNGWREIGTWTGAVGSSDGLVTLSDAQVWLGLKNSDDQGTNFDLRIEVLQNGAPVATADTLCIAGLTRNASKAKEVAVSFGLLPVSLAPTDSLALRALARIGTNGMGSLCGGHSNAVGLRLYFDAVHRDATLGVTIAP
jgi:YVTN family beta-propeller protein